MAEEFLTILGMALVTYACRYPVLAIVSRVALPERVVAAMRFIPPAVLTAIIVPAILMPNERGVELSLHNSYLIGGLFAAVVAWRTKNLLLTILLGMAVFLFWRWWL